MDKFAYLRKARGPYKGSRPGIGPRSPQGPGHRGNGTSKPTHIPYPGQKPWRPHRPGRHIPYGG